MAKIVKTKKLTITILLPLLCIILTACGDLKVGDTFTLKRTTQGGMNMHSMENAIDEMKQMAQLGDPAAAEEHLDLSEVNSFSVGEVVRVTETNDEHRMVQIKNVNPKTGDVIKMWISREELKKVKQK